MKKTVKKTATPTKKMPIKSTIKSTPKPPVVKKTSSHSLGKEDIEKLVRELIRKEFARLGVHLPGEDDKEEEKQDNRQVKYEVEFTEDDPMDIDLVRLENAKDLLAMEGKVEGTDVQVLADTCANLSWIPKSLV